MYMTTQISQYASRHWHVHLYDDHFLLLFFFLEAPEGCFDGGAAERQEKVSEDSAGSDRFLRPIYSIPTNFCYLKNTGMLLRNHNENNAQYTRQAEW